VIEDVGKFLSDDEPPTPAVCALTGHRFRLPNNSVCWRCGWTDPDIAPRVGRGNKVNWTPEMDRKLIALRAGGRTFRECADEIGVGYFACETRVWNISCRAAVLADIVLRGRGLKSLSDEEETATVKRGSYGPRRVLSRRGPSGPDQSGADEEIQDAEAPEKPRTAADAMARKCLRCQAVFMSEWNGNRLCRPCSSQSSASPYESA
jgi:hypothetical protein